MGIDQERVARILGSEPEPLATSTHPYAALARDIGVGSMTTLQLEALCRRAPLDELRRQLRFWIRETKERTGRSRSAAINRRQVVWSELCHRERDGRLDGLTAEVVYNAEYMAAERERRGMET